MTSALEELATNIGNTLDEYEIARQDRGQRGGTMTTTETMTPRIWIGCLAAYNAGKLHGEWVDAAVDEDEIWEAQKRVIRTSPEQPFAEEHFIADHEGFGGYRVGEYESLTRVAMFARMIAEHGPAFAAWLGHDSYNEDGSEDEIEERFTESFRGEWDDEEAFARNLVEELGLPTVGYLQPQNSGGLYTAGPFYERAGQNWSEILDQIDIYLDWGTIARTMMEGYYSVEADGSTYFFSMD